MSEKQTVLEKTTTWDKAFLVSLTVYHRYLAVGGAASAAAVTVIQFKEMPVMSGLLLLIIVSAPGFRLISRLGVSPSKSKNEDETKKGNDFLIVVGLKSKLEVYADICWTYGMAIIFPCLAYVSIHSKGFSDVFDTWPIIFFSTGLAATLFGWFCELDEAKKVLNDIEY